jgi:hypothetical protein
MRLFSNAYFLIQSIFNSPLRNSTVSWTYISNLDVAWDSDVLILDQSPYAMKENNHSLLVPGTSPDDTLFPILAQMEHARENNKELILDKSRFDTSQTQPVLY